LREEDLMKGFIGNIEERTAANRDFRRRDERVAITIE
jgi:hypothetical protein